MNKYNDLVEYVENKFCVKIDDDTVFFNRPDYREAIIGVTDCMDITRIVYDYDLMAECLMKDDDLTYEDACEWIDYNAIGAIGDMPANGFPIIVHTAINAEEEGDYEAYD